MSDTLLEIGDLTVTASDGWIQVSIGSPHSFHSQTLSDADAMRLAGILWLQAQESEDYETPLPYKVGYQDGLDASRRSAGRLGDDE